MFKRLSFLILLQFLSSSIYGSVGELVIPIAEVVHPETLLTAEQLETTIGRDDVTVTEGLRIIVVPGQSHVAKKLEIKFKSFRKLQSFVQSYSDAGANVVSFEYDPNLVEDIKLGGDTSIIVGCFYINALAPVNISTPLNFDQTKHYVWSVPAIEGVPVTTDRTDMSMHHHHSPLLKQAYDDFMASFRAERISSENILADTQRLLSGIGSYEHTHSEPLTLERLIANSGALVEYDNFEVTPFTGVTSQNKIIFFAPNQERLNTLGRHIYTPNTPRISFVNFPNMQEGLYFDTRAWNDPELSFVEGFDVCVDSLLICGPLAGEGRILNLFVKNNLWLIDTDLEASGFIVNIAPTGNRYHGFLKALLHPDFSDKFLRMARQYHESLPVRAPNVEDQLIKIILREDFSNNYKTLLSADLANLSVALLQISLDPNSSPELKIEIGTLIRIATTTPAQVTMHSTGTILPTN